MKITHESPDLMILQERSSGHFISIAILTSILFLIFILLRANSSGAIIESINGSVIGGAWYIVVIGVIACNVKFIDIILDKKKNKLFYKLRSLVKKDSKEYNLDLDQIKIIKLYRTEESFKEKRWISSELAFILKNNQRVPFGPLPQKIRGKNIPEQDMGLKIANFLNIPFDDEIKSSEPFHIPVIK